MTASARRQARDSPASSGSVYWPSATSSGPLEGGLVRRVPSNFPGVTQSRSAAHWTGADQRPRPLRRSRPVRVARRLATVARSRFRLVDTTLHSRTARQEALKKHMRILEKSRCANNSIWSWTPYCARATSTSTSKPTTDFATTFNEVMDGSRTRCPPRWERAGPAHRRARCTRGFDRPDTLLLPRPLFDRGGVDEVDGRVG